MPVLNEGFLRMENRRPALCESRYSFDLKLMGMDLYKNQKSRKKSPE
jgi:hypothetical protein